MSILSRVDAFEDIIKLFSNGNNPMLAENSIVVFILKDEINGVISRDQLPRDQFSLNQLSRDQL